MESNSAFLTGIIKQHNGRMVKMPNTYYYSNKVTQAHLTKRPFFQICNNLGIYQYFLDNCFITPQTMLAIKQKQNNFMEKEPLIFKVWRFFQNSVSLHNKMGLWRESIDIFWMLKIWSQFTSLLYFIFFFFWGGRG